MTYTSNNFNPDFYKQDLPQYASGDDDYVSPNQHFIDKINRLDELLKKEREINQTLRNQLDQLHKAGALNNVNRP